MVGLLRYTPPPFYEAGAKRDTTLPEDIVGLVAGHLHQLSVRDSRGWPGISRQRRFLQRLSVSRAWRQAAQRHVDRAAVFEQHGRPGAARAAWHTNLRLIHEAAVTDVYVSARYARDVAEAVHAAGGLGWSKSRMTRGVVRRLHVSVVAEEYDAGAVDAGLDDDHNLLGGPWIAPMLVAELSLDGRTPGALAAAEMCAPTLRTLRLTSVPGRLAGHIALRWPHAFVALSDLALDFSAQNYDQHHLGSDRNLNARPDLPVTGMRCLQRLSVRQCPAEQVGRLLAGLAPAGRQQQQQRYGQPVLTLRHVQIEVGWHGAGVSEMLAWLTAHNNNSDNNNSSSQGTIAWLDVSCIGPHTMHSAGCAVDRAAASILQAAEHARHLRVGMSCWPQLLTSAGLPGGFALQRLRTLDLAVRVSLRAVRQILGHAPGLWQLSAPHVATSMASLEESAGAKGLVWSASLERLLLAFDGCQAACEVLGAVALSTAERLPRLRVLVLDAHVAAAIRRALRVKGPSAHVRRLAIRDRPAKW
ncbi:hypothetical protein LPJ53_005619 [Coemansia erecta]|uniref:Uncharacterized protein n=1 Tax=Coemansia erecta TaxID=147472 RepID=A0A9W8CPL9_9FUNG|nr:hypothetical protein LPJ53_005619 [Coemansia erecta]